MNGLMFTAFPKIAWLSRDVVITEKIDGTNASIEIMRLLGPPEEAIAARYPGNGALGEYMFAGSRSRYITPDKDNFGFARWAFDHSEQLWALGPGRHYGEWWGAGIQRRYGQTDRTFSLFNVHKWGDSAVRPTCCSVVPVLYEGRFDTFDIETVVKDLREGGSVAAPGFMEPEGIVVFHTAAGVMFKKTLKDDEKPKGAL